MARQRGKLGGLVIGAVGTMAALAWLAAQRRAESYAGKLVVVTGGSRGFGLVLAREFGKQGARVVIAARDADELDRAAHELGEEGLDVYAHACDVRERDSMERLVLEVEAQHGPIDVFVNNAGLLHIGPATAMTHDDMRAAMDTNFWGAVHGVEAVLPSMLARHDGRIVNICSVGGVSPVPFMLPYSASKAALNGYSIGLNYDLAREGISVTAVHPFVMRTGGPINGTYRGSLRRGLYALMAAADSTMFLALDPRRVARKVVRAVARRETVVFVGWRTRLLAAMQGLMPRPLAAIHRTIVRSFPPSFTTVGESGQELASELKKPWRTIAERSRAKHNQPEGADRDRAGEIEGTPVADDIARLHSPAE
jgi:short-subunit dehydrogenase